MNAPRTTASEQSPAPHSEVLQPDGAGAGEAEFPRRPARAAARLGAISALPHLSSQGVSRPQSRISYADLPCFPFSVPPGVGLLAPATNSCNGEVSCAWSALPGDAVATCHEEFGDLTTIEIHLEDTDGRLPSPRG